MDSTTIGVAVAATALAAVPLSLWLVNRQNKPAEKQRQQQKRAKDDERQQPLPLRVVLQPTQPHATPDVWAERRQRGIAAASSHVKKDAKTEQPFSSKYYYAHNNSGVTGGYKDGLTMEDYAMNGPRLLSRGGKPVESGEDIGVGETQEEPGTKNSNKPTCRKRQLPISKYLWDDPGDSSGVATIRIDQLPSGKGSSTRPWTEVRSSVQDIATRIVGDGMDLSITTSTDTDFHLRIAEFYGSVGEVEAVSKSKRLLVRIKKKKGLMHQSNTNTWPHPQKKTI